MQPGGAHILLDDDLFDIDRGVENHYIHRWFEVGESNDEEIVGSPGKKQYVPETMMWTYDDWAGGEGNRNYFREDFDVYDVGYELNPRIRGQLTGRPNRRRTTVTTKGIEDRPCMTVGAAAVWVGGGYELHFSTNDPTTWTSKATSGTAASDKVGLRSLSTSYRITAMAGHNDYVYFSAWHSGSSGSRALLRAVKSDAALADTVETQQTGVAPYAGLAIMNGKLYGWTGRKLFEMDVADNASITSSVAGGVTTAAGTKRKVYDTGTDPTSSNVFSASWWANCVSTENSVIMFYSNDGVSNVYEYKKGVGKPIWQAPYGFTIKAVTYQNGVAYFAGHWGGDENAAGAPGQGILYALPLDSYRVIPLKWVRNNQNVNLQMQEMCASYGYQIMVSASHTGRIFIYDAESDGLTMFDDLERSSGSDADSMTFINNDNRIGDMVTWGPYRYLVIYRPGSSGSGTYQIMFYDDDRPEQRETGLNSTDYTGYQGYFESSRWDYDFPMERKTLVGFHLTFRPLASGQTIDVSYDHDDDGTFTSLTQITSATSGASVGRVFIPVSTTSSQVKFFALKFRAKLSSSSGVATPILYAITAESKLIRKREEWEIVVRLKDEPSKNRPSNRQARGWRLRDWIEETVEGGNVVTFRDGYRYSERRATATAAYSTHNVIIKQAEDVITKPGEGSMRLLLRAVTEAT